MDLVQAAADLDAADPLARWRDRFLIPDPDLAYLDGNSLGIPPKRAIDDVRSVIEHEWAGGLIRSWDHWVDLPMVVGDELAPLIGARPGEVVVHDSVSVNLYQLLHAACRLHPERTVLAVDRAEFPTDRYLVESVAESTGRTVVRDLGAELDHTLGLGDVAVVVRSVVDYRTAEVADVAADTARIHAAGAEVIWDLSHAVGLLPVDLTAAGARFAVGCTYKYLNGGPGAPGFTFVARDVIESVDHPLRGWWSHEDMFAMPDEYRPRADIGRMQIGTAGILGLTAARAGISITAEAGIEPIAAKARALTAFAIECSDHLGLECPSPRDPARRGGHVGIRHPDAKRLTRHLADHDGVLADFREPDVIRLGCSPLTTRYRDVAVAVTAIAAQVGR